MKLIQKKYSFTATILAFMLFSTYLFEGYLTNYYEGGGWLSKKIKHYKKTTGKIYDLRSTAEIYDKMKKVNKNVSLDIRPKSHLYNNKSIFPLSGASYSKTIHCNDRGYYSIYESDRYGFNNPDNEWDKAEHEYLILGDGHVHNNCINSPNGIASVLRKISKKSVINLGYNGNGPLIELATLKEYIKPNIKNILWIYHEGSDTKDLQAELNSLILKKYLNDETFSQNLIQKQTKINQIIFEEIDRVREDYSFHEKKNNIRNKVLKFVRLNQTKIFFKNIILKSKEKNTIKIQSEFKKILSEANNLAKKNNSKFYFVYLPNFERYKNNHKDPYYDIIKKITEELGISFINIHSLVFEKEDNPLNLYPFQMKGFYTIEGYKKVTKSIYNSTN